MQQNQFSIIELKKHTDLAFKGHCQKNVPKLFRATAFCWNKMTNVRGTVFNFCLNFGLRLFY